MTAEAQTADIMKREHTAWRQATSSQHPSHLKTGVHPPQQTAAPVTGQNIHNKQALSKVRAESEKRLLA